jgi:phosphopentomutase
MKKFKRVILIVLDSVGIGHAHDAAKFDDRGTNTLLNIDKAVKGLSLPALEALGLGYLDNYLKIKKTTSYKGYYARLSELSLGKDTMTGHWEIMGLNIVKPFKTFTDTGFPKQLLDELSKLSGHGIIGNVAASGTEIIKQLGEQHLRTKDLIVYTSADSVIQIAAHEDIVPIPELYKICEIARKLTLKDEWKVGRVIARPFIGTNKDNFKRTANRHDYALSPFAETYLDILKDNNFDVISVGKISDIFNGAGITKSIKTKSNAHGIEETIKMMKTDFTGLCFVNLVDFDSEYGHRRDPIGYGKALVEFDNLLPQIISRLNQDDLLILTADHGNDPTYKGTDHTRENVPLLVYSPSFKGKGPLNANLDTFANIGATIIDNFGLKKKKQIGTSFLDKLD